MIIPLIVMVDKFSILQDGKFWRWTVVAQRYLTPLNCSLNMVKIVYFVLFILPQVTVIKRKGDLQKKVTSKLVYQNIKRMYDVVTEAALH